MRFNTIYNIIVTNSKFIDNVGVGASNGVFVLAGWNSETRNALKEIRTIPFYKKKIDDIFLINDKMLYEDKITLGGTQKQQFTEAWDSMIVSMENIVGLYRSMNWQIESEDDSSFEVKIPESKDFDDFTKNINSLNQFFNICPIFNLNENKIKMIGSDIGSTWFIYTVSSVVILKTLGKIVDTAIQIRSHFLTTESQKESLKILEHKSNIIANIDEIYEAQKKIAIDEVTKQINSEFNLDDDPERDTKIAKSIDILEKLINKGLEINASIKAPEDVKAVFPPVGKQRIDNLETKLLEEQE